MHWARDVIERQVAHLARLVDELLDISRIARGKITLKKARVELSELVRQACEAAQPLMLAKGHRFDVMLPEKRVTIDGDLVRLVQVLQNLLDNAAIFPIGMPMPPAPWSPSPRMRSPSLTTMQRTSS